MGAALFSDAVGSTTDGGILAGRRHRGYMSPRPTRLRDTLRPPLRPPTQRAVLPVRDPRQNDAESESRVGQSRGGAAPFVFLPGYRTARPPVSEQRPAPHPAPSFSREKFGPPPPDPPARVPPRPPRPRMDRPPPPPASDSRRRSPRFPRLGQCG